MTFTIAIPNSSINSLDLSPATTAIDKILAEDNIASNEQQLSLDIQYELEAEIHGNFRKFQKYDYGLFVWMQNTRGCHFYSIGNLENLFVMLQC